jgi:hypothetical protein
LILEEPDAYVSFSLCLAPGSPWENGYCESFNPKLRDELLNGEILYSLAEARVVSGNAFTK